jgi:hypothetical protein
VARVLIVGPGARGDVLARELKASGHAVRGPVPSDPASVVGSLDAVAVLCWLGGEADEPRLRAVLEKLVDTPVRGVAYEPVGEDDRAVVAAAHRTWRIPVAWIEEPDGSWPEPALRAVWALVDSRRGE